MAVDEVYPNAPVSFVALEVRHPVAPVPGVSERRILKALLDEITPVQRSDRQVTVEFAFVQQDQAPALQEFPKYFSRNSTLSVGFRPDAIVIECTEYPGWTRFRKLIQVIMEARAEVIPPDGIERIGLRYLDEIRIPRNLITNLAWTDWVSKSLLNQTGLSDVVGLPEGRAQGVVMYGTEPGQAIVIRYGAQEGFAVDPNGPLRKRSRESGPFFLIDIDSYWNPEDGTPEFSPSLVTNTCEILHKPVRSAFEHLITSRLREEVLRVG